MQRIVVTLTLTLTCLTPLLAIDPPVAAIHLVENGEELTMMLTWTAVAEADYYGIYSCSTACDEAGLPLRFIDSGQLSCEVSGSEQGFFYVTAEAAPQPPAGFCLVHAGTFTMGQNGAAMPEHTITLTRSFFLAEHEVTNAEYRDALQWAYDGGLVTVAGDWVRAHGVDIFFLGDQEHGELLFDADAGQFYLQAATADHGSWGPGMAFPGGYDPAAHPVKYANWYGAACYCDWLSLQGGLTPFYNGDWSVGPGHDPYQAEGYTLPTEAEWEHAARYHDGRRYPWGDYPPNCNYANFWNNYFCVGWTRRVGVLPAGNSQLGLQDLAGNIWEWCNDWWDNDYYYSTPPVDPPGPVTGVERIMRGGFWFFSAEILQSASRGYVEPEHASYYAGFRPRLLVSDE